jgi:hemerythrin-like domain-containing protein
VHTVDQLKSEHVLFQRALEVLKAATRRLSSGRDVGLPSLRALLQFFETYVSGIHQAKEDELLFPMLEQIGIPRDGPIAVMHSEHDQMRQQVGRLLQLVDGDMTAPAARERFCLAATEFEQLQSNHIVKEDRVMFVLAERFLRGAEEERLTRAFEQLERERQGAALHADFALLVEDLWQKWISRPLGRQATT